MNVLKKISVFCFATIFALSMVLGGGLTHSFAYALDDDIETGGTTTPADNIDDISDFTNSDTSENETTSESSNDTLNPTDNVSTSANYDPWTNVITGNQTATVEWHYISDNIPENNDEILYCVQPYSTYFSPASAIRIDPVSGSGWDAYDLSAIEPTNGAEFIPFDITWSQDDIDIIANGLYYINNELTYDSRSTMVKVGQSYIWNYVRGMGAIGEKKTGDPYINESDPSRWLYDAQMVGWESVVEYAKERSRLYKGQTIYWDTGSIVHTSYDITGVTDTYIDGNQNLAQFRTVARLGSLVLTKNAAYPEDTDEETISAFLESHSLVNATYGIYASKEDAQTDTECLDTFTTNENGISNSVTLGLGTYYIKELSSPDGFLIDDDIHEITVEEDVEKMLTVSDMAFIASKNAERDESDVEEDATGSEQKDNEVYEQVKGQQDKRVTQNHVSNDDTLPHTSDAHAGSITVALALISAGVLVVSKRKCNLSA